jgi:hypothetical protein
LLPTARNLDEWRIKLEAWGGVDALDSNLKAEDNDSMVSVPRMTGGFKLHVYDA